MSTLVAAFRPIHVFMIDGDVRRRRVVIYGGYCDDVQPTLQPGERVVERTWRSDLAYINHPAKSQDDYQEAGTWLWPNPY